MDPLAGEHLAKQQNRKDNKDGSGKAAETEGQGLEAPDISDRSNFISRNLSWLEFNRRVLEEAEDPLTPSLEKLKFLSIVTSNLDEFFMVRVGGLYRIIDAELEDIDIAGLTASQQIERISEKVRRDITAQYECYHDIVKPEMAEAGIQIYEIEDLDKKVIQKLDDYFRTQVFPILTPLAVDAGHPFPYLGNLKLNLMILFKKFATEKTPQAYAFVEVPAVLPRLVPVDIKRAGHHFILLEDLVKRNIGHLFPGMKIDSVVPFRVTRNQDYDLHENEVSDLLKSVEAELKDRSNKIAVRLEVEKGAPKQAFEILCRQLNMDMENVYEIPGPINLCRFMSLYKLPVDAEHRDLPFNPRIPQRLAGDKDVFSIIREGDVLLHHPFDSFAVTADLLATAADDPDVLAIKQTLYRMDKNSPIIASLLRAAENGKHVTAVIELKARFDESHNIDLSRQMEEAGVNPVFGFVKWKTHCKATLIVRREGKKLRRYVHLSSGNYNSETARLYTDLSMMTCDPDFGNDVSALFNVLTGFNSWSGSDMFKPENLVSMFSKIAISPVTSQQKIHELIDREIEKTTPGKPGRIIAKMNALVDKSTIRKLYEASMAGVQIDLLVRGICCLRPGMPVISENIRVTSILDRYLEHTRIYYFHNGGDPEIWSGSADWMPRNFRRRAEVLYPIEDKDLKSRIINEILMTYLADNVKARVMGPDGTYHRRKRGPGKGALRSQSELIAIARKGGVKSPPYEELVRQIGKKKKKKKKRDGR
jgi:polyphosphate kinase